MKEHYFTVKVTVTAGDASTSHFEIVGEGVKNPEKPVWNDETGNWEAADGANAEVDAALRLSLRDAILMANLSV